MKSRSSTPTQINTKPESLCQGTSTVKQAKKDLLKPDESVVVDVDDSGEQMSASEISWVQSMIGAANPQNMKVFFGTSNQNITFNDGHIRITIVFQGCSDCEFTINSPSAKVFMQGCKNITVHMNDRIVTSTVEAYKCDNLSLYYHTRVETTQIDVCNDVKCAFDTVDGLGFIIWAGCQRLQVSIADKPELDTLTGFDIAKPHYEDIVFERTQFKLHYLWEALRTEKIIRLANGFPTTKREADAHNNRRDEICRKLIDQCFGGLTSLKKAGTTVVNA
ncbi:hypothetical protein SARC_14256 [Sphaeroforma arctica JP610]|uniref:Adenylate cyclase-associated CAP C-terminal domain-containing protein n=1 Tax=Sphaeroforma arctica JP610 TaxID=667725 RepID=A0A0L0F8Y8_9EUKA|nr:hypothetical protein SARC_14256 [Sphaeroforma arctica JP610]KNC73185.1 hypothetical protein SARC_14256 [Sphaeroforma arctica JP610]|eukprot:XP_014147087.1 hypothetical protein SARC_14256 [Sphaeroforma arctica JP610]